MAEHPTPDPTPDPAAIDVRPFDRSDEPQLMELLRVGMYGEDFPDLPGFWQWKHYDNPFGESFGLVAVDQGRIVGLRVFMHWLLRAGDRVYRAARAVDTVTHPDWRRRGFFERLTLGMVEPMRADGIDLTFNLPNDMSLPGYLKMGWAHLGKLPLRVRVHRPLHVVRAVAGSGGLAGASAEPRLFDNRAVLELLRESAVRALVEESEAGPAGEAAEMSRLGDADAVGPGCGQHDSASTGLSRAAGLRTLLSPEYLEWHYGLNRWTGYMAAFDARGGAAALVIGRPRQRGGMTELLITEVVRSPGARGHRLAARVAARLAREAGADYAAVSALGDGFGLGFGYVPVGRRGIDVTLRILQPSLPIDPTGYSAWAAGIGDLELF